MFFTAAALALGAQTLNLAGSLPIYCVDSHKAFQPVEGTTYGSLKAAFQREYRFTATLTAVDDRVGQLVFRGGELNAETITYVVGAYEDGIALFRMHVRLNGATDDLSGDDMCWRTFSILHAK